MPEAHPASAGPPAGLARALCHPWTWRMAWRDSRSQRRRLAVFGFSIVAGIAALVAIHGLKASVEGGIEGQAKALLGSDLQITAREDFPPAALADFRRGATDLSREVSFASMMSFPRGQGARLVQVRGFEGRFPYYGEVGTLPEGGWEKLHREGGILLEPALMAQFGLAPGDEVRLGRAAFKVLGGIHKALPRSSRFSGFAPEAYLRSADLEATGLLGNRSLASFHLHLEMPEGQAAAAKRDWRKRFDQRPWRFETPEDRRESIEDALEATRRFLGIIALIALVLGALGVASAVQAHLSRRVPVVAILRCLGCPPGAAYAVFLAQVLVLGAAGTLAGVGLGVALQTVTLALFRDSLPFETLPAVPWMEIGQVALAGFALCCGFALFPLRRVRDIRPADALREGAGLPPGSIVRAWPLLLALFGLVVLAARLNSPGWPAALALAGGLFAAFGLLAATARLLMAATRRWLRPGWSYELRQGLANLYRPHNQTLLFLLSLGLAVFLLLLTILVQRQVLQRVSLESLKESPGMYLVDVQPDQVEGVAALLRANNLPPLESAPMVAMRLRSVNGVAVGELLKREGGPKWVFRREFRSTYREAPNQTETVVAGTFHDRAGLEAGEFPVSLEEKLAADLGVGLGDPLVLDIQGVDLPARVTSLRRVDWSRFNLNFFMIFPPEALAGAPGFHVFTARLPAGTTAGPLQNALARDFPNVSVIDLSQVLATVAGIVGNIVTVVRVLAGFTLLAGLAILTGVFLNGRDQRLGESVLLRTLGASSASIRRILAAEYAALGLLSALAGVLLAQGAAWLLARHVIKTTPVFAPGETLAVALAAVALALAAGLATSRGVSTHPPLAVLRRGG
jgi:putative ABC transport system permease protein